jgi:hypothetical protein
MPQGGRGRRRRAARRARWRACCVRSRAAALGASTNRSRSAIVQLTALSGGTNPRHTERPSCRLIAVSGLTDCQVPGLLSRSLTPGPPPLALMNSTPAASRARLMARLLGVVIDVSPTASSARRIVVAPTDDAFARSAALQRTRARAARIWALVRGGGMLTKVSTRNNLSHKE